MPFSGLSSDDVFPYINQRKCSFWPAAGDQPVCQWWSLGAAAACGMCELSLAAPRLYKEPQWQIQSDPLRASSEAHGCPSGTDRIFLTLLSRFAVIFSTERNGSEIKTMKERRNTQPLVVRCKLVLVGDVQCGKTAMLQVLAKDCYPEVMMNSCTISRVSASRRSLLRR